MSRKLPTYNFFVLMVALLGVTAFPHAPAAYAQGIRDTVRFEGKGVVSPGPCSLADVFTASDGRTFEIDHSRVDLPKGVIVSVEGSIYPRVSLCKKFPWLDVNPTALPTPRLKQSSTAQIIPESLDVTVGMSEFIGILRDLASFATRTTTRSIYVRLNGVPDGPAFANLMLEVATHAPELAEKIEISIADRAGEKFVISGMGKSASFPSWSELKRALYIN